MTEGDLDLDFSLDGLADFRDDGDPDLSLSSEPAEPTDIFLREGDLLPVDFLSVEDDDDLDSDPDLEEDADDPLDLRRVFSSSESHVLTETDLTGKQQACVVTLH